MPGKKWPSHFPGTVGWASWRFPRRHCIVSSSHRLELLWEKLSLKLCCNRNGRIKYKRPSTFCDSLLLSVLGNDSLHSDRILSHTIRKIHLHTSKARCVTKGQLEAACSPNTLTPKWCSHLSKVFQKPLEHDEEGFQGWQYLIL